MNLAGNINVPGPLSFPGIFGVQEVSKLKFRGFVIFYVGDVRLSLQKGSALTVLPGEWGSRTTNRKQVHNVNNQWETRSYSKFKLASKRWHTHTHHQQQLHNTPHTLVFAISEQSKLIWLRVVSTWLLQSSSVQNLIYEVVQLCWISEYWHNICNMAHREWDLDCKVYIGGLHEDANK